MVVSSPTYQREYHVGPDGRFLMMRDAQATDGGTPTPVVLVLNWFEELKERVPLP